jgi:hypothetical protein
MDYYSVYNIIIGYGRNYYHNDKILINIVFNLLKDLSLMVKHVPFKH